MRSVIRTRVPLLLLPLLALAPLGAQPAGQGPRADVLLGRALNLDEVEGRLPQAIAAYERVLSAPDATRGQKARAQFGIAQLYERLGRAEAREAYGVVVEDYAGEDVALPARAKLAGLGGEAAESVFEPRATSERKLWDDESYMTYAISPDGRTLAYIDLLADVGDIWLRSVDGGEPQQLTHLPASSDAEHGDALSLIWSPDGTRIAYLWGLDVHDGRHRSEIRTVDVASGVSTLVPGASSIYFLNLFDWSPDGTSLLTGRTWSRGVLGPDEIVWLRVGDGAEQVVDQPSQRWFRPRVSPDGTAIAFSIDRFVRVVSASGGASTQVTDWPGRVVGWLAEGLIVDGEYQEKRGLWLVHPDAPSQSPLLLRSLEQGRVETLSRGGAALLVFDGSAPAQLRIADRSTQGGSWEPGGAVQPSPSNVNGWGEMSWSPTGSSLVSRVNTPGSRSLARWSSQGVLTTLSTPFVPYQNWGGLTWLNEDEIVVAGREDIGQAFYRLGLNTNESERLTMPTTTRYQRLLAMAPDGQTYYKHVNDPESDRPALVRVDVASGAESLVHQSVRRAAWAFGPLSADGQQFVLRLINRETSNSSTIALLSTSGNEQPRKLCDVDYANWLTWSADEQSVLFVRSSGSFATQESEIMECSVEGGDPVGLGIRMPSILSIAMDPEGRRIAYVGGPASSQEVWLLENLTALASEGQEVRR